MAEKARHNTEVGRLLLTLCIYKVVKLYYFIFHSRLAGAICTYDLIENRGLHSMGAVLSFNRC